MKEWTSINVEANFDDFRVGLSQELRLKNNVNELKKTFTDVEVMYKLHKYVRLSANYRFSIYQEVVSHRYYGNVTFRYKLDQVRMRYRLRLMKDYRNGELPNTYLRNKLTFNYDTNKPFEPFIASEIYYHLFYRGNEFDKWRFSLGVDWNMHKRHNLRFFYLIQTEFNVANPERDFVLGVGYNYVLRK